MPIVHDLMTRKVIMADPQMSVQEAARRMSDEDMGCLVICEYDRPVGIVTERDVLRKIVANNMDPEVMMMRDIMSAPIIYVDPGASIREAARLMLKNAIRRLPVLENGKLVGIITARDITESILGTIARPTVTAPVS